MIFLATSMSDLATRNRSFFPPERMRSTALQGAATGSEVSSGLAAPQDPAKSWTFTKYPRFAHHLCLPRATNRSCSLLPVALWRDWPPGQWCQDESKQTQSCSVLWAPGLCL